MLTAGNMMETQKLFTASSASTPGLMTHILRRFLIASSPQSIAYVIFRDGFITNVYTHSAGATPQPSCSGLAPIRSYMQPSSQSPLDVRTLEIESRARRTFAQMEIQFCLDDSVRNYDVSACSVTLRLLLIYFQTPHFSMSYLYIYLYIYTQFSSLSYDTFKCLFSSSLICLCSCLWAPNRGIEGQGNWTPSRSSQPTGRPIFFLFPHPSISFVSILSIPSPCTVQIQVLGFQVLDVSTLCKVWAVSRVVVLILDRSPAQFDYRGSTIVPLQQLGAVLG